MSTFGCFATVALRHLNVDTSSQNRKELNPFRPTGAKIATSKVIIGRKSPIECAKESVKISSDAKSCNTYLRMLPVPTLSLWLIFSEKKT